MNVIKNKEEILPDLIKKYESGKTLLELGHEYKLAPKTISGWLKACGVKMRISGSRKIEIDRELLQRMADEGMSQVEICEKLNISTSTMSVRMKEYGIKINRDARKKRKIEEEPMEEEPVIKPGKPKKRCRSCVFRAARNAVNGCNYSSIIERCRLQKPEECTFYERGRRIDPKSARASKKRAEVWAELEKAGGTV